MIAAWAWSAERAGGGVLPDGDRLLLVCMLDACTHRTPDGNPWTAVTMKRLSTLLGCPARTLTDRTRRLKAAGYLRRLTIDSSDMGAKLRGWEIVEPVRSSGGPPVGVVARRQSSESPTGGPPPVELAGNSYSERRPAAAPPNSRAAASSPSGGASNRRAAASRSGGPPPVKDPNLTNSVDSEDPPPLVALGRKLAGVPDLEPDIATDVAKRYGNWPDNQGRAEAVRGRVAKLRANPVCRPRGDEPELVPGEFLVVFEDFTRPGGAPWAEHVRHPAFAKAFDAARGDYLLTPKKLAVILRAWDKAPPCEPKSFELFWAAGERLIQRALGLSPNTARKSRALGVGAMAQAGSAAVHAEAQSIGPLPDLGP